MSEEARDTTQFSVPARYFDAALQLATVERIDNGAAFFAEIPGFAGVYGQADSLVKLLEDLRSGLEDWVFLKLIDRDRDLPVVDGINLNAE